MKNTTKIIPIIIFLSASLMLVSFGGQKAEWKGKIEEENGVIVVKNPREPMYGEDVFGLEEELSIEKKETSQTEEMFQRIVSLAIDDRGNIFILDKKAGNIKIFDKNGKLLKIVGRKGTGPGEFGAPESCALTPNNELYVYDSVRRIISIFNIDGEFKREVPVSKPFFEGPKFTSKGEIIASHGVFGEKPFFELKKFDSEMSPVLSFTSVPMLRPPKVHVFVYLTESDLKWEVSSRDEIIWGKMTTPEYELFVHNEDGKLIKRITKEFTPVTLSKNEYKKLMKKWFGKIPSFDRLDLIIPNNYPPFQLFIVDDEGRIFVKRFTEVDKSDNHLFDVFDEEGKYIANIILDSKFQFGIFKNKKLFSIEEDKDGYQYVKRYKVTWKY